MLRIRNLLPSITVLLVLLVLAVSANLAWEAIQSREVAQAFLHSNAAAERILASNGDWAIERGMTNGALQAPDPATSAMREQISKRRAQADQAFSDGLKILASIGEMQRGQKVIDEAKSAFADLKAMRTKIDDALDKPLSARDAAIVRGTVATITNLIERAGRLRLTLEMLTRPPGAQIQQLVSLRHLGAEMAEFAGRERARLAGLISAKASANEKDFQELAEGRGQIDLAWEAISMLRVRSDTSDNLANAIAAAEKNYFDVYTKLRQAVLADAGKGIYQLPTRNISSA